MEAERRLTLHIDAGNRARLKELAALQLELEADIKAAEAIALQPYVHVPVALQRDSEADKKAAENADSIVEQTVDNIVGTAANEEIITAENIGKVASLSIQEQPESLATTSEVSIHTVEDLQAMLAEADEDEAIALTLILAALDT